MPINSPLNRVDVVKRDKDVVGKIKVSMAQNIYDADFEYGKQPLRWEEYTSGGGTITHLPGVGGCALFLPSNAPAAITMRQSRPYHRYQPGKSMFMATAIQLGAANTGQIQRFGFFDDGNGMFFEQSEVNSGNPAGMYCVVRSDTNYSPTATGTALTVQTSANIFQGSSTIQVASASGIFPGQRIRSGGLIAPNTFVVAVSGVNVTMSQAAIATAGSGPVYFQYGTTDVRVDYANWSDPQGIKAQIDWTKIQMFWLEYAWYGAGALRWGVLINGEPFVLHELGTGNNGAYGGGVLPGTGNGVVAWSRTGNLPVRYEQRNIGSIVSNTMYHYGVSVMMEGGNDNQRGFTYSYGMNPAAPRRYIAPNVTRFPVLSIQPRIMGIQEFGNDGGLADVKFSIASTANAAGSGYPTATFSSSRALPQITQFIVSGSTTIIQFRRSHGLSAGGTITLSGFDPAGINTSYTASYVSPSTLSIPNSTVATIIGSASVSGASFATNQLAGRAFYYQGTDGLFYMSRIISNTGNTAVYLDAITGDAPPVAPRTVASTLTATAIVAGSNSFAFTGGIALAVGQTLQSAFFPNGTVIVSFTGSGSGTAIVSNPATASSASTTVGIANTFFIGQINRGQLLPLQLMVSSDSLCVIELISSTPGNPVVLTGAAFQQLATLGSPNSFATRDVSATSLTGGEVVSAFTAPAGGTGIIPIDLTNLFPLYNTILGTLPDILTVAVTTRATQSSSPPVTSAVGGGTSATLTFSDPHGLNVGDTVTLSGFVPSTWNSTFTVNSVVSQTRITFLTSATNATQLGTAVFNNGANVGAHLICQEAMS